MLAQYSVYTEENSLFSKNELKIQINSGEKFRTIEASQLALELLELQDIQSIDFKILENNNFSDQVAEIVANSFTELKNLKQLSLTIYDNNFDERTSSKVGQTLSSLQSLLSLRITIGPQLSFGRYGIQGLVQAYKTMSQLSHLMLCIGTNDIQQYGAKCIGDSLKQLVSLKSLVLQIEKDNSLGTGGAIGISEGLSSLKNLNELQLSIGYGNSISSRGMKYISESILSISNLVKLSISIGQMNNISTQGTYSIAETIKMLKNLNSLELILYDNNIEPEGFKAIGLSLGNLKNLAELSLQIGSNNISDEGAVGIGQGLSNLEQLSCLSLKIGLNNNIGPQGAHGLAWGIQYLNNLTKLALHISSGNDIQCQGINEIGKSIQLLRKLYQLSIKVGVNNIKNGFMHLFRNVRYLSNLEFFELSIDSKNNVSLNEIKILSESLLSIKCLNKIDIQISSSVALYLIILIKELNLTQENLNIKYLKEFKYLVNEQQEDNQQLQNVNNTSSLSLYIQIDQEKSLAQSIGLFEGLSAFVNLTSLTLNFGLNYCIQQEGACQLADCIQNFQNLRQLSLMIGMYNNIYKKGASKIGNSLKNLKNIQQLQINFAGFNQIQSQGFRSIVDGFSQLQNLKYLEYQVCHSNSIQSKDIDYLANVIKSMNYLDKLQLRIQEYHIDYQPDSIIALAESISYLSQLRSLSFNLNQWQMFDPKFTFEQFRFIFDLPYLRFLQIEIPSQFKKYIQKIIFRCKRLVVFK